MPQIPTFRSIVSFALILLVSFWLHGCASTAEGITRALVDDGKESTPRQCIVTGPAFGGISDMGQTGGASVSKTLRIVLVHGIGTHEVGWSIPLQQRLSAMIGLNSLDRDIKNIQLVSSKFPGESLGRLLVTRSYNKQSDIELIAYELTWSEITQPLKRKLAYDTGAYYNDKRAAFNQNLKVFLNDRLLDPVAYLGGANLLIKAAASEALCFTSVPDWRELPSAGEADCNLRAGVNLTGIRDDQLIFITHSLGSRIVADALQTEVAELKERAASTDVSAEDKVDFEKILEALQTKHVALYMMANQLPLIDAALPPARVTNQIAAYCEPGGEFYDQRIFGDLTVVAFSDPNDPLSYGLPFNYINTTMDSRLCPKLANVIVNVTDVINPLGLIEIAPPLESHAGYQQDEIVLQIIAGGVGTDQMSPEVEERCEWINIE